MLCCRLLPWILLLLIFDRVTFLSTRAVVYVERLSTRSPRNLPIRLSLRSHGSLAHTKPPDRLRLHQPRILLYDWQADANLLQHLLQLDVRLHRPLEHRKQ